MNVIYLSNKAQAQLIDALGWKNVWNADLSIDQIEMFLERYTELVLKGEADGKRIGTEVGAGG